MGKRQLFSLCVIFLLIFFLFSNAWAYLSQRPRIAQSQYDSQSLSDEFRDRYENDDGFRSFVQITIVVIVVSVLLSIFSCLIGLEQIIIWSFIGGFILSSIIELLFKVYLGIGFGFYSFFASFCAGLGCAMYAHFKTSSY